MKTARLYLCQADPGGLSVLEAEHAVMLHPKRRDTACKMVPRIDTALTLRAQAALTGGELA